ncbi:hypothetical protein JTE90_020490 [Oedothorax gibbosus]|uniref:Ubiquitin-like protease family profile domain-containing protein n=1 Tax=Oedothorax gibbosus TaxID=931172 RepID=A0AAV6USM8_9ARAC|nr:hypothetical protein JTE90_020490 [Oedothorax gibbosus]
MKIYFRGVKTANELIDVFNVIKNELCWWFVSKTTPKKSRKNTQEIGHWVAFFYNNKVLDFFDPAGQSIEDQKKEIKDFLQNFQISSTVSEVNCVVQEGTMQSPNSIYCGEYCIFFMKHLTLGLSPRFICKFLRSHQDGKERDDHVVHEVETLNSASLEIYNEHRSNIPYFLEKIEEMKSRGR